MIHIQFSLAVSRYSRYQTSLRLLYDTLYELSYLNAYTLGDNDVVKLHDSSQTKEIFSIFFQS